MSDDGSDESNPLAWKAFERMHRAHSRGTGCHLTAEMIGALGCTFLAEIWADNVEDDDAITPPALEPTP